MSVRMRVSRWHINDYSVNLTRLGRDPTRHLQSVVAFWFPVPSVRMCHAVKCMHRSVLRWRFLSTESTTEQNNEHRNKEISRDKWRKWITPYSFSLCPNWMEIVFWLEQSLLCLSKIKINQCGSKTTFRLICYEIYERVYWKFQSKWWSF